MDNAILALMVTAGASLAIAVPCLFVAFLCCRHHDKLKPRQSCSPSSCSGRQQQQRQLPVSVAGLQDSSSWSYYGPAGADSTALAKLSLSDLAAATGGFSPDNIIGDGGFGFVYRAVLPSGAAVAVKRLAVHGAAGNREFRAELEVLGSLSHPNLAHLLGYCDAGRDRILVYELLERGSLDEWLHDEATPAPLPWPARLRVARGVAAALTFLHHGRRPPVLHRDVKASNVLLGDGFEAKLADFGLARVVKGSPAASHVSTQAAGTAGYVAPEIWAGMGATAKADVYSFGILLIEIVTGRRPSWPVKANIDSKAEVDLVDWARKKVEAGEAFDVLDCRIRMEAQEKEMDEVKGLLDIARRCTEGNQKDRPMMEEVVAMLNKL